MYYLLWRGKITGPFSPDKIKLMLKGGQISSFYQASQDKIVWERITGIKELSINNNEVSGKERSLDKGFIIRAPETQDCSKLKSDSQPDKVSPKIETGRISISCPLCGVSGINLPQPLPDGICCRYCQATIPLKNFSDQPVKNISITHSFPEYEIEQVIGIGGMGMVYQARQKRLNDRKVAIKVLSEDMASLPQIEDEITALTRLSHPSIVTIFDMIASKGGNAIVMELILGPGGEPLNFKNIMEFNESISNYKVVLNSFVSISNALSYAHAQGVCHLDLKPENILVDHLGHLKIVDFGISKLHEMENSNIDNKTVLNDVYGTPKYSAPERGSKGTRPHPNQDVYSLGVILYELLFGRLPEGRFELPSEINPEMPSLLDDLIEKSLNSHPERRYSSMDEFQNALKKVV